MLLLWVAVVLVLATIVVGTWFVVGRTRELLRRFRDLSAEAGRALDAVEASAARLSENSVDTARLDTSLGRLAASRARLAVLLTALGDVRTSVGRVRSVVPRK